MQGLVSLLDREHHERVEALWREIERSFGVRGVYATPFPHFSYHVAERYDLARVETVLGRLVSEYPPFSVCTGGVGVFTGLQPVVYVPIVRHPLLTRLHEAAWSALGGVAGGVNGYYAPDRWFPHITLSFGDVSPDRLPAIVAFLNGQQLVWQITIDNLSLITDTDGRQEIARHFRLRGS